jgi:carbamoyl-phosphate synthase small subunit
MSEWIYLTLASGQVFQGRPFGASGEVTGEVVFATGMTGYLETLTDPSYFGQIVVQTFPLIGNYGVIPEDFESGRPRLKAYIVKEWCQEPSNFRSQGELDTFLKEKGVVGLWDIDTRALTRLIREKGVVNGYIGPRPLAQDEPAFAALQAYRVENAVASATDLKAPEIHEPEEGFEVEGEGQAPDQGPGRLRLQEWRDKPPRETLTVVLWDFGAKGNIRRELLARGLRVLTAPYFYTAAEILALKPDGVMLSNGPGDPAENTALIRELKLLTERDLPIFGICLGHQLLALAMGGKTEKMKYGHRGANQPVRDIRKGRVLISSQNHGYTVSLEHLPEGGELSFINANDGTCEGLNYKDKPIFSVQFHPEACSGPLDARYLFDSFVALLKGEKEDGVGPRH